MSQVVPPPVGEVPSQYPRATEAPPADRRSRRAIVAWCIAATLCLVTSGIVRGVQGARYDDEKSYLAACPFPLKNLPKSFAGWHVVDGSESTLDPLTTRITGSTDHMMANYVDEMTGVMLSVLVLFGPAEPVMPHTPEICYPSSGFQAAGPILDRAIPFGEHETATFRSTVFAKPGGRQVIRNTVYYSFCLNGNWSPAIDGRKLPRKSPGIFKVQIQRRVVEGEKRNDDEPIEDFVQKLLPIIEKMTNEAAGKESPAVAKG